MEDLITEDSGGQLVTGITCFAYPNPELAAFCEHKAANIRMSVRSVLQGIVTVGNDLIEVKRALGHGLFLDWLTFCFQWSPSTAENYINAARAVQEYPKLWGFDPSVLYLFTRQLPKRTKQTIVDAGPISLDEARAIIRQHRVEEWTAAISEAVQDDPGAALHAIEKALDDPVLCEEATKLAKKCAPRFAALADMDELQMLAAMGLSLEERLPEPAAGTVNAQLVEESGSYRLLVWLGGEVSRPVCIAEFPRVREPAAAAWQSAVIQSAVKVTGARTMDDICREVA